MNAAAALRTEGLSVRYGGVQALDGVDAAVAPGTLVGLIGPNGAGKTTFIDAVGGFTASTGRVILEDQDVSGLRPHERARAGLGRTWQAADLFDDLTVRENLRVAAGRPSARGTLWELTHGRQHQVDGVDTALAELGIEDLADRAADQLTQGQRKLVGVARALAGTPPGPVPRRACRRAGHRGEPRPRPAPAPRRRRRHRDAPGRPRHGAGPIGL